MLKSFLKSTAICTLAAATLLASSGAFADPWKAKHYRQVDRLVDEDYDYARVTHVEPIVRRVRVETPVRECWQETRYEEPRYRTSGDATARTIVGAIVGGVIGHQIGDGRGKDIATAAGAVIGSQMGRNSAQRDREYQDGREYQVERCDVRPETSYEERIEGYDVEYRYNGRTYHTRMPYDPGEKVRIRVAVSPTYDR